MLHGRERELEILRSRLDGARAGTSFALVLAGEAGIGKTALLRQAIDDAKGFRVLRGRGFESEMEIPYAGMLALVRPLLDLAEHLPPQQAAALNSALALGPPTPQDRFAVPVALLALLGAAAEESPLLVAVDDAHWLDPATREALLFAARRLEAEGVGVILTVRESDGAPLVDVAGLERVPVTGLSTSGARSLLSGQVAPSVADTLARATGGNPLALLELPLVLTEDERRGLTPITTPLPTGERVEDLFSARVAELPDRTRRALGVAAALDGGALDRLFAALQRLGLDEEDLAPAESTGVVTVRGSRLQFRHPLIRSAAYHGQTLAERRAAHSALGESATDGRQRAWHLAQAATGQDQGVASGLADAADDARRRGGMAEAAITYARAAELTPFPATAAELQLDGAACAQQAGNVEQAVALLDAAESSGALSPARLNDARRLRGLLTVRMGDIHAGLRILEEESERLAESDPARAAETLLLATPAYMYTGENDAMFAFAQRARDIVGDTDARVAELAAVVLTMARSALGTVTEENRKMFDSAVIDPSARAQAAEIMLGSTHGLLFIERYDEVRRRVDEHVAEARSSGAALRLIYPLALRAELNHRVGRWPAAQADIAESMRLVEETGYDLLLAGHPVAIDGLIAGDSGDLDAARRRGEYVAALGERTGARTILLWAYWLLGRVKLLEGDHAKAADFLLRVPRLRRETNWVETNIVLADGDIGEALVGAGRPDEARADAERMIREGEALGRWFPQAAGARTLGLLDDDYEPHFARARALLEHVPLVHEQARTELLLGIRRRKTGRSDDARPALQAALEAFERLGAKPWEARARDELRLAGARHTATPDAAADPAETLTAQEWRVAQLVAQGMTNREVAGALFLSPKTIEHHLSAIYRKLGVRSRTQLARLFGEEVAAPA